jgi:FkbM family methyltransferase
MRGYRIASIAAIGLGLAWLASSCGGRCSAPSGPTASFRELVPDALLRKANRGREVFRADGMFAFPKGVERVWIDVGAHHMETTRDLLTEHADVAVVAIEPLAECWGRWPDSDRVIGMPVAIYLERGTRDFHVNKVDATSSLGASVMGTRFDKLVETVEVRPVPVLRLEDVLSRVPAELEISYLKSDVQGFDLQVVKSAGEQLRRVYRLRVEVINIKLYEGVDSERPASEQEISAYLAGMGFEFLRDRDLAPDRRWLDKEYANTACWSRAGRLWHRLRYGEPSPPTPMPQPRSR